MNKTSTRFPIRSSAVGFLAGVALQLSLVPAGLAAPQEPRPMTIMELLNLASLEDPQLSPDGRELLYTLSVADWKENQRIRHIWRLRPGDSAATQMTAGKKGENSPRWSPGGDQIAFLAVRGEPSAGEDESVQVFLLRSDGGEARPLTKQATSVSNIRWSTDGKSIYFLAVDPKTPEEKEKEKLKDDIIPFEENHKQRHLWNVDVDSQKSTRITDGSFSVIDYSLSRDGAWVVHHRAPSPMYDNEDEGEIWIMRSDGGDARQLTSNSVAETGAELSPDNATVLFISDSNEKFEPYYNANLFTVPAGGGETRMLLRELPYEILKATWGKDRHLVYFTANTGVRTELFSLKLTGGEEILQLTRGDHSVGRHSYNPGADRHLFTIDKATSPGEVYFLDGESEASPRQITRVFAGLEGRYQLPRQEAFRWKGADGIEVEGLLYYPFDYREGEAYPLCVQTHGGPAAADNFGFGRWSSYVQVLTARGWLVFKPNYRGSTGYGDAFLRDMVGHYYHQSHLDVMTGVEALIKKGIADGGRMVKMGWSGGGHMTNKIITFTDRFRAASSGAGAVNWISMYGQSDVRTYRTPWFGGTPWQEGAPISVYWDHSPLKDISRVRTPTIILVGEKDVRVPAAQSVELFRALRSNGVPTHLYIAPREPHGWEELRHQLFKVNVELEWFERHALGREFVRETTP